jgi:dTMP kinase
LGETVPFITFEGIDGSGKTTQLDLLAEWLRTQGKSVMPTKEPDGGRLGKEVRGLLTAERTFSLDAVEELLLVAAARFDHVRSVIRPALAEDRWVLSDRFIDSTFSLQVHAAGASPELFYAVNAAVVGETLPDLTFILDLAPEEASARRRKRTCAPADPAERTRNFEMIREGFRLLAKSEVGRCRVIDAGQAPHAVTLAIQAEIRTSGLLRA